MSAALAAFARFRVLCAVRDGPRGVVAVNEFLSRELLSARPAAAEADVPGRPVMVLRNDGLLGLFNGDLGLLLPGPDGSLGAVFPAADDGAPRWLPALHLPAHETAFAMTVHKAQGSEFDDVLLLLPASPHRVLSRELLYTALSRARQHIAIVASASVVRAAAASPTQRRSGLQARLREAGA
jgi:exodeoxyribonuclease V alpha subunit